MKLHAVEISLLDRRRKWNTVRANGCRLASRFGKISVDEIEIFVPTDSAKQRRIVRSHAIPAHVRHLQIAGSKTLHVKARNAQTFRVVLFRQCAQKLHSQTDPEHRLS